jgi:two-component system, chemotaxis family, CheB/CheR fusion protein
MSRQGTREFIDLLSSVQMAIVMLGPNLRIRCFTPTAEIMLNLIPTDVGRSIGDIKLNVDVTDLENLLTDASDTVRVREREVRDKRGRWHLLRIHPYKTH